MVAEHRILANDRRRTTDGAVPKTNDAFAFPPPNVPRYGPLMSTPETTESFEDVLKQYEKSHKPEDGSKQIEATVVTLTADSVLLDIGFKTEGILPLTALAGEEVKPGDKLTVSVQGRDPEG